MSESKAKLKPELGGQAVIEGIMMRSPEKLSVAVRIKNGKILLKSENFTSLTKKNRFFNLPFIRGGVVLLESLYLGVKTLSWSSKVAVSDEKNEENNKLQNNKKEFLSNITIWFTVFLGLAGGILLFFYLPLLLTDLTGLKSGFYYNLVDSLIRIFIFMTYLLIISKWKEIQKIFQYHGAEHKSIYAYENGNKLTVENALKYTTHHPRCGTSFIVVVIIVGFFIFMSLGRPDNISEKIIRLIFIPVIGGISYELIKIADKNKNNKILRTISLPGLWLQKITTKEPDESQLKVGLVALRSSLGENLNNEPDVVIINS